MSTTSDGHRGRGGRIAAFLILALVVVVGALVFAIHSLFGGLGGSDDYSGSGYGSVTVHVALGDSQTEIGEALKDAGVVKSVDAYTSAAGDNSSSGRIGPGYYKLRMHMSAAAAVTLLLMPTSLVQSAVVIPEGFTAKDIVTRIASATQISTASLQAALHDPRSLGLPAFTNGKVEGFLYPATYDFAPGTTATQALTAMVTRWKQESADLHLPAAAKAEGLSPYDVVTLASIVQKEGVLPSTLPKIAEVFLNRLHQHMPLGSNATLYYVLGPNHGPLTASDLNSNSPYNTEHKTGLPPTPIDSPGEAALDAALHPTKGPWIYFVTIRKDGKTGFATTYDGFQQLESIAKAHGLS